MKKILILLAAAAAFAGCRTSEKNYRAAYDKAIAGRDSAEAVENTIYGRERRQTSFEYVALGTDTVAVMRQLVKVTDGGGGIRENLRRYCVIVGRFKQRFNAVSMRDRIVSAGTAPAAFVVETGEPYYYVVGAAFNSIQDAASAMDNFKLDKDLVMRPPLPFILEASAVKKHGAPR